MLGKCLSRQFQLRTFSCFTLRRWNPERKSDEHALVSPDKCREDFFVFFRNSLVKTRELWMHFTSERKIKGPMFALN